MKILFRPLVGCLAMLGAQVHGQVLWPDNWSTNSGLNPGPGVWRPITVSNGAAVYADSLDDVNPNPTDIVGGIDHHGNGPYPAGFYYFDETNLMFRIRLEGDPTDDATNPTSFGQNVWGVYFNTDDDPDVDFILQLDSSSDNWLELGTPTSGGPTNGWDVSVPEPHELVADLTNGFPSIYYRVTNATWIDGSHFHTGAASDDYFLDVAVSRLQFTNYTGIGFNDGFEVALATSTSHILYNGNVIKDGPDYAIWSDVIPVPEPKIFILTAFASLVTIIGRTRRR